MDINSGNNPNTRFYPDTGQKFNIVDKTEVTINGVSPKSKSKGVLYVMLGLIVSGMLIAAFLLIKANPDVKKLKVLSPFGGMGEGANAVSMVQNPLTGELYEDVEASDWVNNRPMAVMINNHWDARPQSGLIDADLVYEIVAEGGITRFLAFFLTKEPEKIGPVRSTREYYLVLVKELGDAMLMHIGWSPQALVAIETWPVRSLGRGGAQFWRDQDRINQGIAIEHTAYVNGVELRALGDDLGWEGTHESKSYQFKSDGPVDKTQQCLVGECDRLISIDFWYKGDYSGMFKYDRNENLYLRYSGYDENDKPIALIDQETKQQVKTKNLIIQFVKESAIAGDDKSRLDYELIGSGQAIVFLDGKAIKSTWSKTGRDERTMFYDESGNEMAFNRGKFWISIVPDRNMEQVTY